jgi:uncharacterized protein YehS (DUF1456 family)
LGRQPFDVAQDKPGGGSYIMNRNDILRRVRYIFDFDDSKMMELFELGGSTLSRSRMCDFLKQESDPAFVVCREDELARFLNGLIILKRGKREDGCPKPQLLLNNNTVLNKLKIALNLRAEDIISILSTVDVEIGKSELSAFFRKPDHPHYRDCKDQILRNFLMGLQHRYRGKPSNEGEDA